MARGPVYKCTTSWASGHRMASSMPEVGTEELKSTLPGSWPWQTRVTNQLSTAGWSCPRSVGISWMARYRGSCKGAESSVRERKVHNQYMS